MDTNTNNDRFSFPRGIELVADTAINGLKFHVPAGVTSIVVGGVSYQIADLVKLAETLIKPWKDVRAARAVIRQAMDDRPEELAQLKTFLADLNYSVATIVGRDSEELRQFGFRPKRRRKDLSAEEKAEAAAKAKLTRALKSGRSEPTRGTSTTERPTA
ncbi:MAG: hypothetical protein ACAI25_04300 [Planctomycetota bacterium]